VRRRPSWAARPLAVARIAAVVAIQLLVLGVASTVAVAAGVGGVPQAVAALATPLPDDTLVYDRTGDVLLADLHPPAYQHYERPLSAMSPFLQEATVAIEDRMFWNEPGIDPLAIARAARADARARAIVQGGSTITQQLVKQRFIGDDRSYARKFQEAAIAVSVSQRFSRRQILELYLNEISYGNGAYGAEAAAQIYFHRGAADLDLAQAALLAGLPQAPSLLDPLRNWPAAKARQVLVLEAMAQTGAITESEALRAGAEDLSAPQHLFGPQTVDLVPEFVRQVAEELPQRVGRDAVARGGLRVVTTLDLDLQSIAQGAVTRVVAGAAARDVSDGALAAVDPATGQILAYVGSAGPGVPGGQYDLAGVTPRNPGSSFKIFTYTAAIASGRYTMTTPVQGGSLSVALPDGGTYAPRDFDGRNHGTCALQACLGNSFNVPAVRVELALGVPTVVEQARAMGAPPYQLHGGTYTSDDPLGTFGPSVTLGGYPETPLRMAAGASTLADQGVRHDPRAILRVDAAGGDQLYAAGAGGPLVVTPSTAYIVSQMLSDPANRTEAFGASTPLSLPGRHAAAKTGTAEDFEDGWTVGYTPSLAAAVWTGNADGRPMASGTDGVDVAAVAWHDFMVGALDQMGRGDEWYMPPPGLETRQVDGRTAYYLPGTAPAAG
jgi:membrane peptidoglycan carboxypeptidase